MSGQKQPQELGLFWRIIGRLAIKYWRWRARVSA
jgi:hypothetical protein